MPPSSELPSRGNPNVEPLAQEHVIAAQVPDHTRFFFHDPNLARLPDGRLIIAAPQWGRSRTPDAGTRHLRILLSDNGGTTWDEAPALPYQEGRPFVLDGRLLMFVQEESHRDSLLVGSDDAARCRRRSSAARSREKRQRTPCRVRGRGRSPGWSPTPWRLPVTSACSSAARSGRRPWRTWPPRWSTTPTCARSIGCVTSAAWRWTCTSAACIG